RGYRYPIAVDPDWVSSYDYADQPGLGREGWHVSGQTDYYDVGIANDDPDPDQRGLIIQPKKPVLGLVFPFGVGAQLFFNAPGPTTIRSVSYSDVSRFNDRDRQTLRLGLYGPSFGEADDVFETDDINREDVTLPRTPFPDDQDAPAKSAVIWMFTSPCDP